MTDQVTVGQTDPNAEPDLEALKAAADAAPTTTEEAIEANRKAEEPQVAQRPDNIPEKFWDAEKGVVRVDELAKSYSELESGKSPEETKEAPEETTEETTDEETEEDTEETTEEPTPSEVYNSLNDKFVEKGEFDDEDYAMAEKVGYSREMVDNHLAGQKALAEAANRRLIQAAGGDPNSEDGGQSSVDSLLTWASTGLKPAEIDSFNEVFSGNDVNAAAIKMEELKNLYHKKAGTTVKLLKSKEAGASVDTYTSWAEVTRDMQNPLYKTDSAFQATVTAKLGRSNPR